MRASHFTWMSFVGALLFAASAGAADKTVTLDTGDKLTINWGADWVVGANPPESLPGTLTINGPDPAQWRIVVGPLPPHPTLTADPGNLRMYVRWMARALENGGVEVDPEHRPVEGRSAHGFYFKAHDGRKKSKAQIRKVGGDFTDSYAGAISVGTRPYVFEITWIQGGEVAANAALAAVKTIRVQ